jgi:hypothetical protein
MFAGMLLAERLIWLPTSYNSYFGRCSVISWIFTAPSNEI